MRNLLLASCLLSLLMLCGCPSGQTGIWEAPVYLLKVGDAVIPAGPLTAGEIAEFTITWEDGRAPYTITWDFGGGVTPDDIEMTSEGYSETVTVTLVNDTTEPVEYEGYITVIDYAGDSLSAPLIFTVNPAS